MAFRSSADTSLDNRGLRKRCPDGHPLYWPVRGEMLNYARHGYTGGICTAGNTWDQDSAHNAVARPGRLRPAKGPSPLLSGVGYIKATWLAMPGRPTRVSTEVVCRGSHRLAGTADVEDSAAARAADGLPLPDAVHGDNSQTFEARLLAYMAQQGWTATPRVECPVHRAEREQIEAALEQLRMAEPAPAGGSETAPAPASGPGRSAPPADPSGSAPSGPAGAQSAVSGGRAGRTHPTPAKEH